MAQMVRWAHVARSVPRANRASAGRKVNKANPANRAHPACWGSKATPALEEQPERRVHVARVVFADCKDVSAHKGLPGPKVNRVFQARRVKQGSRVKPANKVKPANRATQESRVSRGLPVLRGRQVLAKPRSQGRQ